MRARADCGIENCVVEKAQIALRMFQTDEYAREQSFIYGPSTDNIVSSIYTLQCQLRQNVLRVEAFWSQWHRSVCDWWISVCKVCKIQAVCLWCFSTPSLLQSLLERGHFNRNNLLHRYELVALHLFILYRYTVCDSLVLGGLLGMTWITLLQTGTTTKSGKTSCLVLLGVGPLIYMKYQNFKVLKICFLI